MIKEGVLCGSHGCQFWPGPVIEAMANKWSDIPVSLNHPKVGGVAVPIGHSRKVFTDHAIGVVTAPFYDPVTKALKAVIKVPQGVRGISQIMAIREVSVGVFADNVPENGQYNGKRYVGRTIRATPDHLALVSDGPGACAWPDCGIQAHAHGALDELRAIVGRTVAAMVNEAIKGGNIMGNFEGEALYPPEVYEANREADELQALKAWEGFPGPLPPEVLALQAKYANKKRREQEQGRGQGHHSEMLLPTTV